MKPLGRPPKDLTGEVHGSLRVIRMVGKTLHGELLWECICECGQYRTAQASTLNSNRIKTCKDCRSKKLIARSTTHGQAGSFGYSPTYISWASMLTRVRNGNRKQASDYKGRGIRMYPPWMEFRIFLEDMGERPAYTTLDRIDNDGNYEPGNCRWADRKTQNNNKRKRK